MTIAISVDTETERLARRLSEATGKPLPIVVKEAIEAQAVAAGVEVQPVPGRLSRDEMLARMKEIVKGFDVLPVLDSRLPDEIIGYNHDGVPE